MKIASAKRFFIWVSIIFIFDFSASAQMRQEPEAPPNVLSRQGKGLGRVLRFRRKHGCILPKNCVLLRPGSEKRELFTEELLEAAKTVTKHYILHGYINSGAVIPDQEPVDGRIVVRIVEGTVSEIQVEGNTRLKDSYIKGRLRRALDENNGILNAEVLQKNLKVLKQNPLIENVNGELKPGVQRGEAILRLEIAEAKPYFLTARFNNHNSPSIGSYRGGNRGRSFQFHRPGRHPRGRIRVDRGAGRIPIPLFHPGEPHGHQGASGNRTHRNGGCRSAVRILGYQERKPHLTPSAFSIRLSKHPRRNLPWAFNWTSTRTNPFWTILRFAFVGDPSAENKTTVARFTQQWVRRDMKQVLAAYSSVNWGIDMFDASVHIGEPDGKFLSWTGQFQWLRRLEHLRDSQLLSRLYFQLSTEALLPSEKFGIGGYSTVRGYVENQITSDNGIVLSLELQVPVGRFGIPTISRSEADGMIYAVPFYDFGRGWNTERDNPTVDTIHSAGLGVRWNLGAKLRMEIFWGYALKDVEGAEEYDLQEDGIHFEIACDLL